MTKHYDHLCRIEIFSGLSSAALKVIASTFTERRFPENAALVERGSVIDSVGYILSGGAAVLIKDAGEQEHECGYLAARQFYLGFYLFSGKPSIVSVVAKQPTVCLVQGRADFLSMLDAYPYLKDFFYRCALERMWDGYQSLLDARGNHPEKVFLNDRMPKCVRQTLAYVDNHFREPVTLDDIAERIGMSRFHLSRLFNRHTGKSFRMYLNQKRIAAAKELMNTEDVNVSEAGFAVGYNDLSYFSRVFRSIEGISPSAFRKSL